MTNILLSRSILGEPFVYEKAKEYIKSTDRVAVLAFSFFPKDYPTEERYHQDFEKGGDYYQKIIDSFIFYGIPETSITFINYYKDNHDSAIKKIDEAKIIYFPGGAPDLMMERIREFDLKNALESPDKVYIGSSAGAMIQFKNYYIGKDYDYHRFTYEEGLNLLSGFFVEVHYRRRRAQKRAIKKVFRAYHENIYGIPEDGAIIVHQNEIKLLKSAIQIYHQKGVFK